MSSRTQIEIDIEVHRAIESARISFNEGQNAILRRILGLDEPQGVTRNTNGSSFSSSKSHFSVDRAHDGHQEGLTHKSDNGSKRSNPDLPRSRDSADWRWKGTYLPAGTEIRMTHNGEDYRGEIKDGRLCVDGITAQSPSSAAIKVIEKRTGVRTSLNGWLYWTAKPPQAVAWVPLTQFRNNGYKDPE